MEALPEITLKLCVLGSPSSGKTNLIHGAPDSDVDHRFAAALGPKVTKQSFDLRAEVKGQTLSVRVHVFLWDILGQRGYAAFHAEFLQGASGALLVGSIFEPDPAASIRTWAETFDEAVGNLPLMILVNRGSAGAERTFDAGPFELVAQELGIPLAISSPKTPERTRAAIEQITRLMAERHIASRGLPEPPKPPQALAERESIITRLRTRWAATHPRSETKETPPSATSEPDEIARH